jgi:enoyl-CoA hydratase/carnithine racemase
MRYVNYEKKDGLAIIKLNRPERANALSDEVVADFAEASRLFAEDPEVRVGILTGSGRFFCTGMDLKQWAETGDPFIHPDFKTALHPDTVSKPVIGAINGWAVAGGMVMALQKCDLLVMAEEAKMAMYEIKRGTPAGARFRVTLSLPPAAAAEIVFGFDISAQRALEMGLVNRVVPRKTLMDTAVEMARHLLSLPAQTLATAKELIQKTTPAPSAEFEEYYQQKIIQMYQSSESLELVRGFADRKKPE